MQRALMEGIQSAQLADGKEPSKGLFFIREHVRTTAPALVDDRAALEQQTKTLTLSRLEAETALESAFQLKTAAVPALASMELSLRAALEAAGAAQARAAPASAAAGLLRRLLGRA